MSKLGRCSDEVSRAVCKDREILEHPNWMAPYLKRRKRDEIRESPVNIAYWSGISPDEHYGILHFMATRFAQVLPNRGVDDNVGPTPEMIVPLRGTNHILLIDGEGLVVKAENPHMLEITEVKIL